MQVAEPGANVRVVWGSSQGAFVTAAEGEIARGGWIVSAKSRCGFVPAGKVGIFQNCELSGRNYCNFVFELIIRKLPRSACS